MTPPAMEGLAAAARLDLDRHRDHITRRLEETFARHIGEPPQPCSLTETEFREVLDVCNTAVAPLGRAISERRWKSYTGVVIAAQSARRLCDQEAFKAVCALNNVTFVWDDMDPALHNFELFLPEVRKICDRYYRGEDAAHAFEAARTWITSDHMFRDSPIKRVLCSTSLEQYFRFRVTDVGVDFWLRMSSPIYRDARFTEHCRSGLAARMATRGLVVVNDAYSFARERASGQPSNCFHLCPAGDDSVFHAFFEALLDGLVEDITCIKAFDEVTQEVLLDLIYGNFLWTANNERYRQPVNDVNVRIQ